MGFTLSGAINCYLNRTNGGLSISVAVPGREVILEHLRLSKLPVHQASGSANAVYWQGRHRTGETTILKHVSWNEVQNSFKPLNLTTYGYSLSSPSVHTSHSGCGSQLNNFLMSHSFIRQFGSKVLDPTVALPIHE